jgi:hypothetical protein
LEASPAGFVIWDPLWDHTFCAVANDLRVFARLASPKADVRHRRSAETRYRNYLGVKGAYQKLSTRDRGEVCSRHTMTAPGAAAVSVHHEV